MFGQVHCPESLSGEELDRYLELGWFRMGQTIFTTNFLNFKGEMYSAIWLRAVLSQLDMKDLRRRMSRNDKLFRTEIRPASISLENEILFSKYRNSIPFEASPSLEHLLFGRYQYNIFQTMQVDVYDGDLLIGCGFFDLGKQSAEGISSFYDPAYKKYSIGKYLIMQKLNYCVTEGYQYFYPGYFVPGYPAFDYKLDIGKESLEFLDLSKDEWCPLPVFNPEKTALSVMQQKLHEFEKHAQAQGIEVSFFNYEYFYVNQLPELRGAELFDYPVFIIINEKSDDDLVSLVGYDVRDQRYHYMQCRSVWTSDQAPASEKFYAAQLLKLHLPLFHSDNAADVAAFILSEPSHSTLRFGS